MTQAPGHSGFEYATAWAPAHSRFQCAATQAPCHRGFEYATAWAPVHSGFQRTTTQAPGNSGFEDAKAWVPALSGFQCTMIQAPQGVCTDDILSIKPGCLLSAMHSHALVGFLSHSWFSCSLVFFPYSLIRFGGFHVLCMEGRLCLFVLENYIN
jgi:hypothetical protein